MTVKGRAHGSYAGKVIQLFTEADYITGIPRKEAQDTIEADGYFELELYTEHTRPVTLKIGQVVSQLYVQPDYVYGITFPQADESFDRKNDAELPVNVSILGADSTELNAMIFDYQEQYNNLFLPKNNRYLSRAVLFKLADSLQKICLKRYAQAKNDYFKNYVAYSIASINASLSRGESFLIGNYIVRRPVLYDHYEYMQFFNTCFKGYFNTIAAGRKGQSLYNIINGKASYEQLDAFLKEDRFLKGDTIRELVMLRNLWDLYFSADFSPEAIEAVISQLSLKTTNKAHQKIIANMLAYINKLQTGSPAPDFAARTKDGTIGTLNSFKGRWVYLNFFSTNNLESMRELPKIAALKKKYGDKVLFLSICLDNTLRSYTDLLKANPKYDWPIWFNNEASLKRTAKDNYFVTGTEAYFLISNTGYISQAPALSPSKGIEYKFNQLFKIRTRTTKTGIR